MDRWVNVAIEQWDRLLLSTLGSTHGLYLLLIFCVIASLAVPVAKIAMGSERASITVIVGCFIPLLFFVIGLAGAEIYFVNPHTSVETQDSVRYLTAALSALFVGCWITRTLWDISYTRTLAGLFLLYLACTASLIIGNYALDAISASSEVVEPDSRQTLP